MLSVPIDMKTAIKKPTASVRISRRSDPAGALFANPTVSQEGPRGAE